MARKRRKLLSSESFFDEEAFSSRITVSGGRILRAENHRGVLEYTDNCVVLALKKGRLCISGEKLFLTAMSGRCLVVRGKIKSAEWQDADENP